MLSAWVENDISGPMLNARFTQGEYIAWAWNISTNLNGVITPVNLTGAYIEMSINLPTGLEVLNTTNGGIIITGASAGNFSIIMPSTLTVNYPPGTYEYDAWVQPSLSSPNQNQYVTGNLFINQSISAPV